MFDGVVAGPLLVTARSAEVLTVAELFALLLPGFESLVDELPDAVFVIVDPLMAFALTLKTSVKVGEAPFASVAIEQLTVPVPPTAGVVHNQPAGDVSETNVVPPGSVSLSVTLSASLGPPFVTLTLYVVLLPATTVAGPLFVTARSAEVVTVAELFALLLPGFESLVDELPDAVFVIVDPLMAFALTLKTSVKAAEAPLASVAIEQLTVPVPPTAGVVQDQPAGAETETNAVFGGSTSVSVALSAAIRPLFVTPTV